MKTQLTIAFSALSLASILAPSALAQEAINTNAALQPPPGVTILRQQFRYKSMEQENGPATADMYMAVTALVYGYSPKVTLIGMIPLKYREMDMGMSGGMGMMGMDNETEDFGLGDMKAMVKYQVYKNNFDIGSTMKAGLLGGAELPSFDDTFSSDSVDPIFGGVVTYAKDRHGLSAATTYQLNTDGNDDEVKYDLGYTFRLKPTSFVDDDSTAMYAVMELNGRYDTNGDNELLLSPGFQYVTNDWTIEATVQLPIYQEVDHRMQTEYATGLVLRFRF